MRAATRYSIAVLTTVAGIALTAAFPELLAPMRLFFLWCAVLVTAIVAGVGPALLALVLSLAAAAFFVFEPIFSFAVSGRADLVRMLLFGLFATAITFGVGFRRRAEERAQKSEQRAAFINRASESLAMSLDHSVTLRTLARLCVPALGDWCVVQLATGQQFVDGIDEGGERIVAPMTTGGRTIGTLTVGGHRYADEEGALIEDLARRAAIALDNARLYEAAEAANRTKDEFLATLSHELRTPLTAIAGWAHLLQLGADEATTRLAVQTIVRSAKTQAELIDDLLDLSRVVAGTLHLNVATVDLVQIAEEVLVSARPAAEAKGLPLELGNANAPILVRGDERRLRQIVWNLVSNAVKFTDRGGRVAIGVTARGAMAHVEIADTGRGIEPAFLPYVWDRFRQADSSTSRQHGGLGLGLAVVRHLVDLHGGTVHAQSAGAGQGATFSFELPLAPLDEASLATRIAQNDEQLLRERRILVVDDDDDARVVLSAMLRQFGAEVVNASSAATAMSVLEHATFDAVVSDIAMPEEDGYALVRRIHATQNIPVIAVSAISSGPQDRQRVLGAGFADFVRKPVEPRQLALAVAGAMR